MDIFKSLKVSASGLSAQRKWMDTIASNLANAKATRTPEGGPYKRRDPVFMTESVDEAAAGAPNAARMGVRVPQIALDPSQPNLVFEPGNPDANPEGYVAYPNVSVVEEMANMVTASRSYEANLQSFNTFKTMATRTLDMFR